MDFLKRIPYWLGITSPSWIHEAAAKRNMPIVAVGSVVVAIFAAMLAVCLFAGIPCPVDGFDEAAHESPAVAFRFKVVSVVACVVLALICAYATRYVRKGLKRPGIATLVTALFSFIIAMLWGIAESGLDAKDQLLVFASIQFLVAGLIVFDPIVSLAYFALTFGVFGMALDLSGQLGDGMEGKLAYLAILDIVVCWVVYGLFIRANRQQRIIADMSRRDELTGAKNRHYLRDSFNDYVDADVFVMLCDIDDFKRYNDSYDHNVGDALLKEFFYALREAYGDECTYRYGGDEFLVVSSEFGVEEFLSKAAKVSEQLARAQVDGADAQLTYSGGYVSGHPANTEEFRTMLHAADLNLLKAKRQGKNRVIGDKDMVQP